MLATSQNRREEGLTQMENGNDTTIECSNCSVPLAQVWIRDESFNQNTKIRAICGHCGDRSFVLEVKGKFYLGGTDYSSIKSIEPDKEEFDGSVITKQEILVETLKVKDYA